MIHSHKIGMKSKLNKKIQIVSLFLPVLSILLLITTIGIVSYKKPAHQTENAYTKGEPASPSSSHNATSANGNSSTVSQPGDQKSNSNDMTSATALIAPFGDFVSAHDVTMNSPIVSVCNTTPGARCEVTFSNNSGVEKSLPSEATDRGGAAYWNNWTPSSIGLTVGSWQIKAIASLNNQTKTTTDAMSLMVAS